LPVLTVRDLPTVNAFLNLLSATLLVAGWFFIKRRRVRAHRACMVAALVSSSVFLTSYLVYHAQVGSVRFPGTGGVRTVYLSILATHTVLAAAVPVLALVTVYRAWRRRFRKHVRIARWTLPIWLYVSVTGVVVYWMLYRVEW
jgi:putative membrane protein